MFSIIKILQPTWYFNLKPSKDHHYFPFVDEVLKWNPGMEFDSDFSETASQLELSYRAHKFGFVSLKNTPGIEWWGNSSITLIDEYLFARKYFHKFRVFLALIVRILMLNNPISEINAYLKSGGKKRISISDINFNLSKVDFQTPPHLTHYRVTVIIPTLNRYNYLRDVLKDLEDQSFKDFNVIVVDQSDHFQEKFYENYRLDLKVIRQEERALWLARNRAIIESQSDLLLFYDDDSRVDNDWIQQHINCLQNFNADISSGVSLSVSGAKVPSGYSYFRWSDQLDTGNVMIKREVFLKTGLFDRQFEKQRMGDGEFGLRAYIVGFRNISNPLAKRIHLKVGEGGLREMGHWDAFRTSGYFSPRPVPSVLYLYRKYHGTKSALISLLINVPPSIIPYQFKRNRHLLLFGSILSIFIFPVILLQVLKSWSISTRMLKKSGIEFLNE